MGKAVITGSGGGGAGSDECTATRAEVLKGFQAITKDSDDELIDGTLELVGTAADSQVLSGQTYYNTDVKTKRTGEMVNRGAVSQALNAGDSYTIPAGYHNGSGKLTANSLASQTGGATADDSKVLSGYTYWKDGAKRTGNMTVSSVVSFNVAQYSNLTLIASWAKPAKGPWSGVRIMCKQGNYPSSTNDGTLFYEGSGTSATKSLAAGTWYLRAWNYMTVSNERIYGNYTQSSCANNQVRGQQTFTASTTFTVPDSVRSIQVFCVGGGGGGGGGGKMPNPAGGGGGGGGKTVTSILSVTPGQRVAVTIGSGGSGGGPNQYGTGPGTTGNSGGTTSFGSITALGGGGGNRGGGTNYHGGNGGCGGGCGGDAALSQVSGKHDNGGNGGSNGGNGSGTNGGVIGYGQGSTTRAFGEAANGIYSGGGGGGGSSMNSNYSGIGGTGGSGGGGNGGDGYNRYGGDNGRNGSANTGGGGGGGGGVGSSSVSGLGGSGGSGGTGLCIIRWGY